MFLTTEFQTNLWKVNFEVLGYDTTFLTNVCDRDVAYDRKSDGPRTTPAPHKICCIYPKKLQLPPNLKVETITSGKTSTKAPP